MAAMRWLPAVTLLFFLAAGPAGATTMYIVGSGPGSITPRSTAAWALGCWGGGQASSVSSGGGAGASYAGITSLAVTAGTPLTFSLGVPGTGTGAAAGGDTWISNSMSKVLLGAYIGLPDDSNTPDPYYPGLNYNTAAADQFASFTSAMGQAPGLMNTYVDYTLPEADWVSQSQWAASSWAADSWAASEIPAIGIPMASQGENADTSFKNIISGGEDSIFNGIFQTWANAGFKDFYIRPGWEMNGNWFPWSVTSSNAADFVAAFQHIANLAHAFSGATIQVVWNPNVGASAVPPAQIYPGNQYVDVVGLDTYGPPYDSGNPPGNTSTDPNTFTLLDALAVAKANVKPFAIPETGGFDPAYISALANTISQSTVPVSFVSIWDTDDGNGNYSWSNPSDNQAAAAAAWKAAFAEIAAPSTPNSGVQPTVTTQGCVAPGGGSVTAAVGNTVHAGGAGGAGGNQGAAGGGGAGGPDGVGAAGASSASGIYPGMGGGGSDGGLAGGAASGTVGGDRKSVV